MASSFEIRISSDQRQSQTASQRLQQSVRLLQMSSLEFAAAVRDAMGRNPFLEIDDLDQQDGFDEALDRSAVMSTDFSAQADGAGDVLIETRIDETEGDRRCAGDGLAALRGVDGTSLLDAIAEEVSLARHLREQIDLEPMPQRDRLLAATIIESLDDDGYLRTPLEQLIQIVAMDPPPGAADLMVALRRVQQLDPPGVGARDLGECLRLQLAEIKDAPLRDLAGLIVTEHLHLLARRDLNGIVRRLDAQSSEVEAACECIRRLDPRPGRRFDSTRVAYLVPDVIATKQQGRWRVRLNPEVVPRLRINQTYADWFVHHRDKRQQQMAGLLHEARWTLRNLEQRFTTVLEVAAAIVERQRGFLEFGPMAMKPMCLREIADQLGIHESTVSRVTSNKFIATPNGVFELKFFFSRVLRSANGSACSGTAIRGLIGEMIAGEPPDSPLSDGEITRRLAMQGLIVARRTVTKYRQVLHIAAVDRR